MFDTLFSLSPTVAFQWISLLRRRWSALVRYESTAATELRNGVWLTVWGLIVAWPWSAALSLSQGYNWMSVLPEWCWGVGTFLVGINQVSATLTGTICRRRRAGRITFSAYLLLGFGFWYGQWALTAAFYLLQAVYAGWVIWRLADRQAASVAFWAEMAQSEASEASKTTVADETESGA